MSRRRPRAAALRFEPLEPRDTPAALGGNPEILAPLAVSGQPNGLIQVYAPNISGQFNRTPSFSLTPFPGFAGVVRSAVGDVNGDGVSDYIAVTGPGTATRLSVIDGIDQTRVLVPPTDPFNDPNFTGGAFVSVGFLDNNATAEIVVTPDQGGGPRVVIFSFVGTTSTTGSLTARANFLGIDDANFRGGARAAIGDVNNDGFGDVLVSAGFLGGPRVALFDGVSVLSNAGTLRRLVPDFFAFPGTDATTLRNGVFVAIGDTNGDGFGDLIFGGGPGGGPRVLVLNGQLITTNGTDAAQTTPLSNFFSGNSASRGGVRVAAKHGLAVFGFRDQVVTSSGENDPTRVRIYNANSATQFPDPSQVQEIDPFGTTLANGVFVG